jgi:hypothetical protein
MLWLILITNLALAVILGVQREYTYMWLCFAFANVAGVLHWMYEEVEGMDEEEDLPPSPPASV